MVAKTKDVHGQELPTQHSTTAFFTFDFCWLSKWLSLLSLIELWIRFATTIVCHKCVSKKIKSFVIGQNDGWNMGRFISGALFLSFPYLFLSDSCPRVVGEEGGPGLSFEAQQFFFETNVFNNYSLVFSHLFIQSLSHIFADCNTHNKGWCILESKNKEGYGSRDGVKFNKLNWCQHQHLLLKSKIKFVQLQYNWTYQLLISISTL